jgi:hypothetical protein
VASFKGYKRSIKLEFDYKEIREGVPNVSKQMSILNAEFRKSSAEAEASGKEIDKLGTRYDYLSNKIKLQEQEVEKYKDRLEKATNAKGNNTKAIQNNTASLEIAKAKLSQTKAELDKVSKELEKQRTVLGKTSKEWGEMGDKLTSAGKTMSLALTAPILAAGAASFKLGADFEQALGKMNVVFEHNSKNIEKWAQNSLRDFGLARSTAVTMASDFGALFKGMGISLTKTEEWSKTLTERAMDLSNFYDTTIEETTTALNAIVTGQTEPLRKFGINMTQAALQEYAFAQGIRKRVSDMTEAEKVQLRYNYVIEKTNIAVGTTARESDSATGQMNRFKEGIKELGISFSEQILPIITPVIEWLNDMIERFSNLSDGTKKFIVIAGGIVATIGPVLMILGSVFSAISKISSGIEAIPKVIDGVSKAGKAFSGFLNSSAFMGFAKWALIIAGVALAIAALVVAINYLIGKGREMNEFSKNMSNMVSGIGTSVQGASIRGYAVGTRYHPGGLAIVGEEGPELVNLPRGSQVYTNQETQDMLSGGGDTYILQVKMSEVDEVYKLVEVFKAAKQKTRAGEVMV